MEMKSGESFAIQLAHGLGGRSDLPISTSLATTAGAIVLAATVVLLNSRWRKPLFQGGETKSTENTRQPSVFASQLVGLIGLSLLLVTAAFGSNDSSTNPAPTWLYVWIWVGVVPLSLLCGSLGPRFNPLRLLSALARSMFRPHGYTAHKYPQRLGYWPAAVSLFAFVWIELVKAEPDRPKTVLTFLILYCAFNVLGGVRYGEQWHARGDGFEVYSDFVAHLSPWRTLPGRLRFANPLRNLATLPTSNSANAVIFVLLGSTAFDGITRTRSWTELTEDVTSPFWLAIVGTLGLISAIGAVAVIYSGASYMSHPYAAPTELRSTCNFANAFSHSLLPVAIGYTFAHYFSLLLFQGQVGFASPFGTNAPSVDYSFISTTTIAFVQVGAILAGHVIGVIAAHDRAIAVLKPENKHAGQYPLIAAMVGFTMAGLALLLSA